MADAVTNTTLFAGTRRRAVQLTNVSDGTGESAVIKVDKSTLIGPNGLEPSKLVIEEIIWSVKGFDAITLAWDHTTDDTAEVMSGNGGRDYTYLGGLADPASVGGTGDLVLTTIGAAASAVYDITLILRLKD